MVSCVAVLMETSSTKLMGEELPTKLSWGEPVEGVRLGGQIGVASDNALNFTLTVENNSGHAVEYNIANMRGENYDFVLYEVGDDGKEIFLWTSLPEFLKQSQTIRIAPGETRAFPVSVPLKPFEGRAKYPKELVFLVVLVGEKTIHKPKWTVSLDGATLPALLPQK